MNDDFSVNIDSADDTKINKIDAKWIYETDIESPEILGSGSSFSYVVAMVAT